MLGAGAGTALRYSFDGVTSRTFTAPAGAVKHASLDALDRMGIAFESFERAIDAHIKNIRKKIEPEPSKPRYIQTVYGVGYRFADQ